MTRLLIGSALALALAACGNSDVAEVETPEPTAVAEAPATPVLGTYGIATENMDTTVDPGDDFFLTLMLVPAMYGIGVDITRFFRGLWRGEKQPGFGSTYDPDMAVALDDLDAEVVDTEPPTLGGGLAPAE